MNLHSRLRLLVGTVLAFALVAAACGADDDEASLPPQPAPAPATTEAVGDDAADEGNDVAAPATTEAAGGDMADEGDGAADGGDDDADDMSLVGTVVKILGPETGPEGEAFLLAFAPFEERTGIDVRYSGTPDAVTELNLAVEAGDPPDITIIPQPGRIIQFGETGDAVPIPQSILDRLADSYDPFWFDLATTGGKVYGVPNKGDVKSLVWYSRRSSPTTAMRFPRPGPNWRR